jgi:hypothetical protein
VGAEGRIHLALGCCERGVEGAEGGRHTYDGVREGVERIAHSGGGVVDLLAAVTVRERRHPATQVVVRHAAESAREGSMKLGVHGGHGESPVRSARSAHQGIHGRA